ncbi:aromatic ring-hydroxylating dioxygenase subunit alpha [Pandoraea sp. PE-S2R-1]|uniref:aromatic ring-hydroxylating dioxygenase subunit alpha n=1 Tax=Pandoraea sp. PE-S2R-1 TaxID=1986994 RepID=UPI000B406248|nr:aromatic ring-hydroxylating dioxygenase subunit alpha [Pandoraea sp. PE-S2R-1]
MLILNTWYVAAIAREVTQGKLFARTLLDVPVVMYRKEDGNVVALEDRCCHRHVPLSLGAVVCDTVRCGYHGFRFDETGRCVEIPGQDKIPAKAHVKTFPIVERHGLIWIWMGDPAKSDDHASIPEALDVLDKAGWDARVSHVVIEAGYRLIVDNLHDGSHAEFVHEKTLKVERMGEAMRARSEQVERSYEFSLLDGGIEHRWKVLNAPGGPAFVKGLCLQRGLDYETHRLDAVDWRLTTQWYAPAVWVFTPSTTFAGEPEQAASSWVNLIAITPQTDDTTHYFWGDAQDFAPDDPKFADFFHGATATAFAEDLVVFEAQQRNLGALDVFDFPVVTVGGDAASIQARRILDGLKLKESGDTRSAPNLSDSAGGTATGSH